MTANPEAGEQELLAEIRRRYAGSSRPRDEDICFALSLLDARDARIATLTEAIKPFAEYAAQYFAPFDSECPLDATVLRFHAGEPALTFRHFLAAAAVLYPATIAAPAAAETIVENPRG